MAACSKFPGDRPLDPERPAGIDRIEVEGTHPAEGKAVGQPVVLVGKVEEVEARLPMALCIENLRVEDELGWNPHLVLVAQVHIGKEESSEGDADSRVVLVGHHSGDRLLGPADQRIASRRKAAGVIQGQAEPVGLRGRIGLGQGRAIR